jgi:WXG100 family type VII secretion target
MQMGEILVQPNVLRTTSQQIRDHAARVEKKLSTVDREITALAPVRFEGNRASRLRSRYQITKDKIFTWPALLQKFSAELAEIADRFEQVDRSSGMTTRLSGETAPSSPMSPAPAANVPAPAANTAPVINVSYNPSSQKIINTINRLVLSPKYQKAENGDTYCNIFAMDFAKEMGAYLPEYLDYNNDGEIDRYLNANQAVRWLRGTFNEGNVPNGPRYGWQSVDQSQAASLASQGYIVVAGYESNGSEPGHMAIVRPESQPGNIMIAQAGGQNFAYGSLIQGFGSRKVEYFVYKPGQSL